MSFAYRMGQFFATEHDKSQPRPPGAAPYDSDTGLAMQPPGVTQVDNTLATRGRGQWTASRRDRHRPDNPARRPPPGGFGIRETKMSDILADYREWAASREEPVGTHSGRCHLWHPVCMIVRLARELERTRAENADYRREVREQRREIAGLREERAMLLGADRTPGADATPGEGSERSMGTQGG